MTWIPVWSVMVLVKAAFSVQKVIGLFLSSGVVMWIASSISLYFGEYKGWAWRCLCVCVQPVKRDYSSSYRLGFGSPNLERKQNPHLSTCNTVLNLCTFPQLGLWKSSWSSVGFFHAHLNDNCSHVSCITLVAAQSCGVFLEGEDEDLRRRMHRQYLCY